MAVSFILLACFLSVASAQNSAAIISSSSLKPYEEAIIGFRSFFRDKDMDVSFSEYSLDNQEQDKVCREIAERKPDVVFILGSKAARLAKERIGNIPAVFCMVLDPSAVVNANMTGITMDIPVSIKLKMIKRLDPRLRKLGLLYSRESMDKYEEIATACQEMGLALSAKEIVLQGDIPDAIKEITAKVDCFLMIPDPKIYFSKSIEHLLLEGLRNKVAVIGLSSFYTKAGAFVSIDCDYRDLGWQCGNLALRIFGGQSPSTLSVERPVKIKYSLNRLVAERLGIKVPPELLREASEIFGEGE